MTGVGFKAELLRSIAWRGAPMASRRSFEDAYRDSEDYGVDLKPVLEARDSSSAK